MSISELDGSELGTKQYWDKAYRKELRNYKSHGDVGEIWFEEESQYRVTSWIMKQEDIAKDSKIVDVGCGNGLLLIDLAAEGYANLLGVDYSADAIELATSIAADSKLAIGYEVADLLCVNESKRLGTFKVVVDKGTYDAISLNPDDPKEKRQEFLNTVWHMMDEDSYYVITSCNWTEDELIVSFENIFSKFHLIPTPTFSFGGKIGSVVTSMVFKKNPSYKRIPED